MENSDRPATIEDYAAVNWAPWEHKEGEMDPPSNKEWAQLTIPHLITLRIAWGLLHKTKAEAVEVFQEFESTGLAKELLERFGNTDDFFQGMQEMVETARLRFMSAGAAVVVSENGPGEEQ